MIAVTTQQSARERLRHVALVLGFPSPGFFRQTADLPPREAGASILFVDLGSCAHEAHLRANLSAWLARNQAMSLVLYVPLLDRDAEMHAMFDLASLSGAQVMTASDFARLEVWHNLVSRQLLAARQAEIRADFLERVAALGLTIPAERIVLHLLIETPAVTDVHAAAAAAMGHVRGRGETVRVAVWRELRRAGQLSATRLLLVFQLLWYRRLADLGWSSGAIASFLGFRSARELRLTLKRRLGLSMHQIRATPYQEALAWAVASCSEGAATNATLATTKMSFLDVRERTTFRAAAKQAFCG
ncbi:MAG TPA: hypothetical protein VHM30_01635 [Gemmatimonadaceae bacterium]|nr:hypothetical protein [Gemmatimonadaceae bacterium]